MEKWPHGKENDLYPKEDDPKKKLISLDGKTYDEEVMKSGSGPWFISFIDATRPESGMIAKSL